MPQFPTNLTMAATLLVAAADAPARVRALANYRCDGVADEVQINAALSAASEGGGEVRLSEGTFALAGPIAVPNDGQAQVQQKSLKLAGAGAWFNGRWSGTPQGGTILDISYTGSTPILATYGAGYLEITGLTFRQVDAAGKPTLVYTTNTTIHVHGCAFVGAKSNYSCDQDAIVLGGNNADPIAVLGTTAVDAPFQGYGTRIEQNFFSGIRRGVTFQTYANAVYVGYNTWSSSCGGDSAIRFMPIAGMQGVLAGNVVEANLIECAFYDYAIWVGGLSNSNTFIANGFYDPDWGNGVRTFQAFIHFESTAGNNLVVAGFWSADYTRIDDDSGNNRLISANPLDGTKLGALTLGGVNSGLNNDNKPLRIRSNDAVGHEWRFSHTYSETSYGLKMFHSVFGGSEVEPFVFERGGEYTFYMNHATGNRVYAVSGNLYLTCAAAKSVKIGPQDNYDALFVFGTNTYVKGSLYVGADNMRLYQHSIGQSHFLRCANPMILPALFTDSYPHYSGGTTPLVLGDQFKLYWDTKAVTQTAPTAAPTDARLPSGTGYGSINFYLDESAHNLLVRVKYSNGTTLKTGSIALV
jgi:hypothetical protein